MKSTNTARQQLLADQFGMRVALNLNRSSDGIHPDIAERLRVARQFAVSRRRVIILQGAAQAHAISSGGGQLALGGGWKTGLTSALSLIALVSGLMVISVIGDEQRAHELADVDTELLADELPLDAYVDPGFAKFLQMQERH